VFWTVEARERIVHERGSDAHGYVEPCESLADASKAAPFA
jgi:catalase